MTFAEALHIFTIKYGYMRAQDGRPVMLSEYLDAMVMGICDMLGRLDDEDRAALLEAVHRALDDRIADPVGGGKEALN